jgi:hypothetical protein
MADNHASYVYPRHSHGDSKLQKFPAEPLSSLSQFSAVILTAVLLILFLIRNYILEGFLLERIYGAIWNEQSDRSQRSFLSHHVSTATKIVILIVGCYPFFDIIFGQASFHSSYASGSDATMGDILVVMVQTLFGLYLFELLFRASMPTIAILHHLAAIILGQVIIALSLGGTPRRDVVLTFIIMMVWGKSWKINIICGHFTSSRADFGLTRSGAFDVIVEIFPHIAMILYRVFNQRHRFLRKIFLLCSATIFVGALCETILVIYFYASIFSELTRSYRLVIPLLHLLFTSAQFNGCHIFWRLYRKQQLLLADEQKLLEHDLEAAKMKKYAASSASETSSKSSVEVENRLLVPKPSRTRSPTRT